MVAIIGTDGGALRAYLEGNGVKAAVYQPNRVSSLTALLLGTEGITDLVILPDARGSWSMGHILSTAKQLQDRGRLVFYGGTNDKIPPLIAAAGDKEALLRLLKKPVKPAAKASAGGQGQAAVTVTERPAKILPLEIPPEKILILGVVGSQRRIGCTTQAVGLWHYCKALGFDPAIVAGQEQIAQIAGTMQSQAIQGGYRVQGIPFVTDAALTYDCYILDVGTGAIQDALGAADHLILVVGSKPWELQHTAAALRAARGRNMLILLSFSAQRDAESLAPLFGQRSVGLIPWMPELWTPSPAALALYDRLLRPTLERLLARDQDREKEEEPQLQLGKGE